MDTRSENHTGFLERNLLRLLRLVVRADVRAHRWLISRGCSNTVASVLLWTMKLAVLAGLLVFFSWLVLIAVICLVVARFAPVVDLSDDDDPPAWTTVDPEDHREDLFYDPISYNDDPDPRFPGY